MECPVCYVNAPSCSLVCGHAFCRDCVKSWYYKTTDDQCTCPMCRSRLYFKGMQKYVKQWEEARDEQRLQDVYAELFEETVDEGDIEIFGGFIIMDALEENERRFNKFVEMGLSIEEIDYMLYTMMDYASERLPDEHIFYNYEQYLFVTKNIVRKSHRQARNNAKKLGLGQRVEIVIKLIFV